MKKVLLFLAIIAIGFGVDAQNQQAEDQPIYPAVTQPTHNPLVNNVINITNTNGTAQKPTVIGKKGGSKPRPVVNFITNNYHYHQANPTVVEQRPSITPTVPASNNYFPGIFWDLLGFLILVFLVFLIWKLATIPSHSGSTSYSAPPVTIHNHIPAAPKPEAPLTAKTVSHDYEKLNALVAKSGGSLRVYPDGSYRTEFPKVDITSNKSEVEEKTGQLNKEQQQ